VLNTFPVSSSTEHWLFGWQLIPNSFLYKKNFKGKKLFFFDLCPCYPIIMFINSEKGKKLICKNRKTTSHSFQNKNELDINANWSNADSKKQQYRQKK
jgi:hypothetical protein